MTTDTSRGVNLSIQSLRVSAAKLLFSVPRLKTLAFVGVYIVTLSYFLIIDVYHDHYFSKEYVISYNIARCLFTFYLFWIIQLPGRLLLERLGAAEDLRPLDLLTASFFSGASIWTLLLLGIGYAHHLYWSVAVALTVPAVTMAYRHFAEIVQHGRRSMADALRHRSALETNLTSFCLTLVAVSALLLFSLKALYPAGGHDYYTHYFPYYEMVIKTHSIWPNDVWYHYYYDKGDGLFFISMLLTDPLQTALVSYCFAIAVACALWSLLREIKPDTLWPWVGVILYFTLYSHTWSVDVYAGNGGWGDFQKPHEINGALIFAAVWMSSRMINVPERERRLWLIGAALAGFAVTFMLAISIGILGLLALIAAAVFFIARAKPEAWAFFILAVACGSGLAAVLLLNYITTGLPLDVGINFFWPIVNLRRVNSLGYLYNVAWNEAAVTQMWGSQRFTSALQAKVFFESVFHVELLRPLIISVLAAFSLTMLTIRRIPQRIIFKGTVYIIFFVSLIIFSVVAGASQKVSYIRVVTFMLPMSIAACGMIWQTASQFLARFRLLGPFERYVIPIGIAGVTLFYAGSNFAPSFAAALRSTVRFDTGAYSIYDGFKDQSGLPGRMPWGAEFPPSLAAWKLLGPGTRIWSFHIHSYCMVPGCDIESIFSFIMSRHVDQVYFGSPEEARSILKAEGLNYFMFSFPLQLMDAVQCAPLFSPANIGRYLGTKWTDGQTYLLTWLGPGITPLSNDWIAKYKARIESAGPGFAQCDDPTLLKVGHAVYRQVFQEHRNWGYEVTLP